ncbi:pyridoxal-dependent decarboxylase [Streptomyces sp. TLI_146]|uniref:pyridoxal-dependent decarboxylase n=1 Tax=Streptomyces sp. TLI_146 TaxID=1938858 RepID=UPI000C708E95|nr:pyridoxal-dependent decarboxylase [Streptomyces sp. TLI_146]PKV82635.1 L-histidine carboxy-lyase (histamine-forming) [Streptomyces sp. TLI_146]
MTSAPDPTRANKPPAPGIPEHRTTWTPVYPAETALHIGELPSDPLDDTVQVLALIAALRTKTPRIPGFANNRSFNSTDLGPAPGALFNDVPDPTSNAGNVDNRAYEQAVVRFIAQTAEAPPEDTFGYVTPSDSEGLLFGLATGRRRLPHAAVYASDQAHDSVATAADLLGMKLVTIPTTGDGVMDAQALKSAALLQRRIRPHLGRGPGAIVVATIGTVMRGAYDDVTELRQSAATAGGVHVHADAACGGLIAAHAPSAPRWNFAHGADSLSISGHEILGALIPCGVVLTRRHHVTAPLLASTYAQATRQNPGHSRSGLAALLLWCVLRRLGHSGLRAHVLGCLATAQYAVEQLTLAGVHPTRTTDSLTVGFDRPAEWITRKWHLVCEGSLARLVTAGHVTRTSIDALCRDLRTP